MAGLYRSIEPQLRHGAALGFSHGLAVHFGFVAPRGDLDLFLVAPKGPGTALRSLYEKGQGMLALWAVGEDRTGNARGIALAYGRAIGCGRAGLIESSFAEECEADLFNEGAVVWGAVPELLVAGFDTLVEAGVRPEVAYLECVGELKLLAELIEARGIAGMREAISNTAELGAVLGGPQIIDDDVRERMRAVLAGIRERRVRGGVEGRGSERLSAAQGARANAPGRWRVEAARRSLGERLGDDILGQCRGDRRCWRARHRRAGACGAPRRRPGRSPRWRASLLRRRAARNKGGLAHSYIPPTQSFRP